MTFNSDLGALRQCFPALRHKLYFNYGGQGPMPQVALDAIRQAYDQEQSQGPFCASVNTWITDHVTLLRSWLAQYLHTTPDRIALTESTTLGMNIPLWGLDWRAGDQIVISDAEHPGVRAIARVLAQRFGVELVDCPLMSSPHPVQHLQQVFTDRTRMVLISHVLWNTGRVMPLADLAACCHAHGILLHVDAAQSAGVLPLDLPSLGVDFYAFTGHKWLCGPAGVGALYISASAQQHLQPTYVGWRSLQSPMQQAGEFEVATTAWPLLFGWQAALHFHEQVASLADRYTQQMKMAQRLWHQLRDSSGVQCLSPDPPQAGLVAFTVAGQDPVLLEAQLAQQQILLRYLSDPLCLRASVHYFTTAEEIDQLVAAIAS